MFSYVWLSKKKNCKHTTIIGKCLKECAKYKRDLFTQLQYKVYPLTLSFALYFWNKYRRRILQKYVKVDLNLTATFTLGYYGKTK